MKTDRTATLTFSDGSPSISFPILEGTVGPEVIDIRPLYGKTGRFTYDPGFMSTAACESAITYIDGDKGILEYRGYPIEQLAEKSTFLEVAYLLIHGELPSKQQYDTWVHEITYHTFVHENVKSFMEGFRYDAHPMGMLMASVGALSTFYPDARNISDADNRHMQIVRMIAKMPTLGAWSFRHAQGKPFVYPDNDLGYTANFLSMLFKMSEQKFDADERLVKALDVLFILHADHEQNCSTNAVRSVGSSQVDPYSAVAAGVAALYGPLHGGANEAVLRMLRRIGSMENIPAFIEGVKNGNERLMGFGHRVYRAEDPRARHMRAGVEKLSVEMGQPQWYRILAALVERVLDRLTRDEPAGKVLRQLVVADELEDARLIGEVEERVADHETSKRRRPAWDRGKRRNVIGAGTSSEAVTVVTSGSDDAQDGIRPPRRERAVEHRHQARLHPPAAGMSATTYAHTANIATHRATSAGSSLSGVSASVWWYQK